MDTDSFILSYSGGNIDNKHMNLSNLDIPLNINNKVPGKFEHELGSKIIEEFIVLKSKTYNLELWGKRERDKKGR